MPSRWCIIGSMYDFYDDDDEDEVADAEEIFFTDMRKLVDGLDDVGQEMEDMPDEDGDLDF